jgi:hypothetical protein
LSCNIARDRGVNVVRQASGQYGKAFVLYLQLRDMPGLVNLAILANAPLQASIAGIE